MVEALDLRSDEATDGIIDHLTSIQETAGPGPVPAPLSIGPPVLSLAASR